MRCITLPFLVIQRFSVFAKLVFHKERFCLHIDSGLLQIIVVILQQRIIIILIRSWLQYNGFILIFCPRHIPARTHFECKFSVFSASGITLIYNLRQHGRRLSVNIQSFFQLFCIRIVLVERHAHLSKLLLIIGHTPVNLRGVLRPMLIKPCPSSYRVRSAYPYIIRSHLPVIALMRRKPICPYRRIIQIHRRYMNGVFRLCYQCVYHHSISWCIPHAFFP